MSPHSLNSFPIALTSLTMSRGGAHDGVVVPGAADGVVGGLAVMSMLVQLAQELFARPRR